MKKVVITIIATLIGIGIGPLFCMWGWGVIAQAFNLPTFSYGQWWLINLGFHALLAKWQFKISSEDD